MNSNTFEDQPGQERSYKFGSLAHVDPAVRDQAVALNLETIAIGRALGAKALTIWIGDGSNFPGQAALGPSFERYLDSLRRIYRGLPRDWRLFLEYKPFEPAFYYTVLADWGSALMASLELGERCAVLVDLGHHLPGTNIEAIVARLIRAGKLGGFHLNDNHYADDDLTAGSIQPYRLFRVFHELVLAGAKPSKNFRPAYMIDQSHNVKDPIEALIQTTMEMQNLWARALLVNQKRLAEYQRLNDTLGAEMELKDAFNTDVRPLTAMARVRGDAAAAPLLAYRAAGYRSAKARERG
jgi:L-rhamnose isomerase/sugar isomerase